MSERAAGAEIGADTFFSSLSRPPLNGPSSDGGPVEDAESEDQWIERESDWVKKEGRELKGNDFVLFSIDLFFFHRTGWELSMPLMQWLKRKI